MQGTTPKTVIAEDVEITGTVKCASHVQLDGKLNGDLNCNGNAIIGTSAAVKGNISVESITVMGNVTGNIIARDRIELKATTRLSGDIKARRLTVEDGVTFVGKSEVNPSGPALPKAPGAGEARPPVAEPPAREEPQHEDVSESKAKGGLFGRK